MFFLLQPFVPLESSKSLAQSLAVFISETLSYALFVVQTKKSLDRLGVQFTVFEALYKHCLSIRCVSVNICDQGGNTGDECQ